MISQLSRPATVRPASLLALFGALLLALVLALPGPAQAHDTLLSTDPEDGATLETSPEAITFTFSGDVLDVSPLVRISDESGTQLAEITPTVDGATATATLPEPLPAGTHTVQWRVVSGDGHPIEGTLTLTVEQGPQSSEPSDGGGETTGGTADEDPATASDAGGAEPQSSGAEDPAAAEDADEDGGLPMPVLLGILAVIVVGAAVAVVTIVRRRD